MAGSKVKLWKQDPTVTPIGIRSAYLHTEVEHGPKDSEIEIAGMPEVRHNTNGDFLFVPQENPKQFDAVHTFTGGAPGAHNVQACIASNERRDPFLLAMGSGIGDPRLSTSRSRGQRVLQSGRAIAAFLLLPSRRR